MVDEVVSNEMLTRESVASKTSLLYEDALVLLSVLHTTKRTDNSPRPLALQRDTGVKGVQAYRND